VKDYLFIHYQTVRKCKDTILKKQTTDPVPCPFESFSRNDCNVLPKFRKRRLVEEDHRFSLESLENASLENASLENASLENASLLFLEIVKVIRMIRFDRGPVLRNSPFLCSTQLLLRLSQKQFTQECQELFPNSY